MLTMQKQLNKFACIFCSMACALFFCACGKQSATNQAATAEPTAAPVPVAIDAANNAPPEQINLSAFNADIARLEDAAAKTPDDEALLALARAYLARAKALAKARSFRPALDDCRRVLQYDPDNEEAPRLSASITEALQQQGREVPTEGNEPPPLGITPDTIAGDEPSNISTLTKAPTASPRKKGKQ
jgi:tetratricopeptide (TPR) repeat protein